MDQLLGIIFHSIGGFSSASFYVPYSQVKQWAWGTYWIVMGFVAWMVLPTIGGFITTPDIVSILKNSATSSSALTFFFGFLWGFGGLFAGLGLRYLGLSLGQSISLGVSAIVGTVIPAIMEDKLLMLFTTVPGAIILAGFVVCIIGIALCGYAGMLKDRLLPAEEKKQSVKEFSATKGFTMAILGGIFSACMAFAIHAGAPIAQAATSAGTSAVFVNIPIFVFALAGGFTSNLLYYLFTSFRKNARNDYFLKDRSVLRKNFFLALLSGLMWYGQFFFYGMGSTKMGVYDFASWSIHMSSIILFSNLWGIVLKEWKSVDKKTWYVLGAGIVCLFISVVLIGMGNSLSI